MNVKKFFASTSRQALHQVRQGLGPDALILSNRAVVGGVEILAVEKDDLPAFTTPAQMPSLVRHGKPVPATTTTAALPASLARSAQPDSGGVPAAAAGDPATHSLMSEIRSMRGMLEEQLVYKAWDTAQQRDPGKARVLSDLLRSGFSPALARQFLGKMPSGLSLEQKRNWVKAVLDRNLRTVPTADEIVERGGTYALVGPTGVGKTTTVAKIAARCVVRHGADRLALLTTDSYRIGAHEQLRIYGKLLGVRVIAIKDAPDLQFVLDDLRSKHLVLIDTVGMSQRDQMVAEQLALLSASGTAVQRLLLLNATSNGETLDDVVRSYRGGGVHGCIITKTDEAAGIATALDVVVRHQLMLHYVTNGQRVPEDLHLPQKAYLLDRALRTVKVSSAHQFDAAECQLMLSTASRGANAGEACFA